MLLLVTIALVLVAAVTLLIGIISDNLALIFISIGASAVAAIVLAVLSQMSRKKGKSAADGGAATSPADDAAATAASPPAAAEPAAVEPTAATVMANEPTTSMPAVSAPAAGATSTAGLPVDDYDNLRVNQILPLLDDLDLDELEAVAQYEETHKNRSTVLNRIDARMDILEDEEAGGGAGEPADDEPADDETVDAAVAAIEDVGQPVMLSDESDEADEDGAEDDGFPIPDYDDLSESELIPLLDDLDADELETVADREEAGQNRDGVLDAIDDRLDILEGIVPAPAAAPARKAPAKSPARKSPAAKAPVRKATPTRKVAAAPAKRTPAKKVAAPAPVKRTPAKKAAPAKATGTTRKAAVRTAATVKKAAPVKKATAAKKTTKKATKR